MLGPRAHSQASGDCCEHAANNGNSGRDSGFSGFSTPNRTAHDRHRGSTSGEGLGSSGGSRWSSGTAAAAGGASGGSSGGRGGRPPGGSPLIFGEHSMDAAATKSSSNGGSGGSKVSPSVAPRQLHLVTTAIATGATAPTASVAAAGPMHAKINPLSSAWIPPEWVGGGGDAPGAGQQQEPGVRQAQAAARAATAAGDADDEDDMPAEMSRLPQGKAEGDGDFGSGGGGGDWRTGGLQYNESRTRSVSSVSQEGGVDRGAKVGQSAQVGAGYRSGSMTRPSTKLGGKDEYALFAIGDE